MAVTILVVEDEAAIRSLIEINLKRAGYAVALAADATVAQAIINESLPALVLLDWMLPGVSGIEYARRLRRDARTKTLPIIMLTARGEERDKVDALEGGADDYVTKPFSARELMARIKALLRRNAPHNTDDLIKIGELLLDPVSHRVSVLDATVSLGPTEFRLLHFLMAHPERVHSRTQLLDRIWGDGVYVEERTVDVHIRRLRAALESSKCDDMIQTVRGTGYRFSARQT